MTAVDPIFDPNCPSLAEALLALKGKPGISAERFARVSAAIRTAERLLGQPASAIPAHPMYITRQFAKLKQQPVQVSRKTIANTKSELRYLLAQVVQPNRGHSEFRTLSPEWAALKADPALGQLLWALSRFMAYCSSRDIAPAHVTAETVAAFEAWLEDRGDVANPQARALAAIMAWNKAASQVPNWPGQALPRPPKKGPPRVWLPAKAFPESFRQDLEQWCERLERGASFDQSGPQEPLRPITIRHRRNQILKAASALVRSGMPIDQVASLVVLLQPTAFRDLLKVLKQHHGRGCDALEGLAAALVAVGRHHLRLPEDAIRILTGIAVNVRQKTSTTGTRTRQRVEALEVNGAEAKLLHLPQRLLEEAATSRTPARQRVPLAQMAIAHEILLLTGLRKRNITELNLSQITPMSVDGKEVWRITFAAAQIKNKREVVRELPAESVALIKQAMQYYGQTNGWLFPGRNGRHKNANFLGKQYVNVVSKRIGTPFNMHAIRGFLASKILSEDPMGFERVRAILGDKDDKVIRQSYTPAAERALVRHAQQELQTRRLAVKPRHGSGFPR
ncbi:tyrosine-type recombinase/integrase [Ferrovibrio sp.]|uniref:tyrosine-type recombinase/integrase n=1 Tax=Ferrovibrio sp. TaxID=1917215 RepID=UPI001B486A0E|nr:tyrosine-type recombinase/integrase [Ferrovibrio sp.]MBP7065722.1 tyrosine-type recombinase/integrase [Ferrovibrio sp.]